MRSEFLESINKQTELTSKIETDSQINSRLTALGREVRGWRDWAKRTHEHGQQCGDCRAGGGGYKEDKW